MHFTGSIGFTKADVKDYVYIVLGMAVYAIALRLLFFHMKL